MYAHSRGVVEVEVGSLLLEESGGVVVVLELELELLSPSGGQSRPCPAAAPVVLRVQSSDPLVVLLFGVDVAGVARVDVLPESARRMLPVVSLPSLERMLEQAESAIPSDAAIAIQCRFSMSSPRVG